MMLFARLLSAFLITITPMLCGMGIATSPKAGWLLYVGLIILYAKILKEFDDNAKQRRI